MGKPPASSAGATPSPPRTTCELEKLFPVSTDARTPGLAYLNEDHDLFFLFLSQTSYILLLPAHNLGRFPAYSLAVLCIAQGIRDA